MGSLHRRVLATQADPWRHLGFFPVVSFTHIDSRALSVPRSEPDTMGKWRNEKLLCSAFGYREQNLGSRNYES